MDLSSFTQGELHNALGTLFFAINTNAVEVNRILTGTDKFDAELSMQVIETLKASLEAGNALLVDSLHKQGLNDEQIQERIEHAREQFDIDP